MQVSQPTTSRPRSGDELELSVDRLAYGGAGVARLNNYVVFVDGGVPGDRVRARIYKSKRAYAHARVTEILTPSAHRIDPMADHPGVGWQVLPYEYQLRTKQEQVVEAFERIGKLTDFELLEPVKAVKEWRYRNKVEYSFGTSVDGELICGFHKPGHFDLIEPISDCKLVSERSNEAREQVLAWCREQGLSAWDRRTQEGFLRNLVIREGVRTGELQVRLVTTPGEIDKESLTAAVQCDGLLITKTDALGETTQRGDTELIYGASDLYERIGELDFAISPDAFFQTNTEMAEVLYAKAIEFAQLRATERVYDLFSGIGTIALCIAARVREVVGVELIEQAVQDAIANARRNEITNAFFFAGDVRVSMRELVERAGQPDVIFVDPPRAGLSQKVVRRIIETKAKRLVYVSCNPTTLAANAAQLDEAGWALKKVGMVDMFPQTPHIECVALFDRTA